ncbi:hypothetical protein [Bradyrhizobium sp. CCBAU 65884]|uniref:hypothetical protein n=1 Tax=Bradyrhizobium sp. CCBAU 65884 TaxID=722477 RepID=UPI0023059BEB|nr:hypothetical protein [Bradyrhizobium sp. CCBAU 65884]
MALRLTVAGIAVVSLLLRGSASAQDDLAAQREALKLISGTAADICYTVEQNSRSTEWIASLGGRVSGLISKIVGIGVSAAGEYKTKEAQGVLQQDLAKAIKDSGDCKTNVFNKLVERLLPAQQAKPVPVQTKSFKSPDIDAQAGDGRAGKAFKIELSLTEIGGAQPYYIAQWTWTGSGGSQRGSQNIIFDLKANTGATVQSLNFPIDRSHCYYRGHPETKTGTLNAPIAAISAVDVRTTVLEGRVGKC